LKKLAKNKHASLSVLAVSDEEKRCLTLAPACLSDETDGIDEGGDVGKDLPIVKAKRNDIKLF
jgi:hypothetical protein